MAIAPDRLRYVLWGTLLAVLCFGGNAWDRVRQDSYWDAAAWATLGGLLILGYTRPHGSVRRSHAIICGALHLLGAAAWLTGTGTTVRIAGFVLMAGALVVVRALPQTGPPPRLGADEPPVTLGLSE